jgi:glutamine amidotransferase
MTITVVDYGAGNIRSVLNAIAYTGEDALASADPEILANAERIILPGVGAAGSALGVLRDRGLADALDLARKRGTPILGICLGLQMLAEELDEFGTHKGLGWIDGRVGPIADQVGPDVRVPHIGWARIDQVDGPAAAFFGRNEKSNYFYFCHSNCLTTIPSLVAATVDLTTPIVAAVQKENVLAVQFHPEKSQINGIRFLEAFLDWQP